MDPWFIVSVPINSTTTTKLNPAGMAPWSYRVVHGYVAFMQNASAREYLSGDGPGRVLDGLNDAGLSVGAMTLINSTLPAPDPKGRNIHIIEARGFLLATCANVSQAVEALSSHNGLSLDERCQRGALQPISVGRRERRDGLSLVGRRQGSATQPMGVNVWATLDSTSQRFINHHFTVRDAAGDSLVVEFIGGEMRLHHAGSGDAAAALGVVTNEPELPWHARNAELWRWKRTLSEPAVSLPGGFYPDERFLRALVLRDAARTHPPTLQDAVADTFGVLSSVSVPLGTGVPGTDTDLTGSESGYSESERMGDHTRWSAVRDHSKNGLGYYWRDEGNPGVRRLLLADSFLGHGESPRAWPMSEGAWFDDAKPAKMGSSLGGSLFQDPPGNQAGDWYRQEITS